MKKQLILASSSPRRQELLKQAQIPFQLRKQEVDESIVPLAEPVETVTKLAKLKGESMSIRANNEVILTADTVVAFQNNIFGKPRDEEEAYRMISALSGNRHDVYTGVMIRSLENAILFTVKTEVEFWNLSDNEIRTYVHTREPYDKAGAYGIQGIGALLVKSINGDYFNVVGLPLSKTVRELRNFGIYPV